MILAQKGEHGTLKPVIIRLRPNRGNIDKFCIHYEKLGCGNLRWTRTFRHPATRHHEFVIRTISTCIPDLISFPLAVHVTCKYFIY